MNASCGGLIVTPAAVAASGNVTGTVTLTDPAPDGGIKIALSASDGTMAQVPRYVNVPAGATGATFPVMTFGVAAPTQVTLTGTSWTTPATTTITVPLNAGANSVKFANDTAFAPDLDKVAVT